MTRALRFFKRTSRVALVSPETRARLARSSRAFLLGLVVACGIEVVVDGSSTLSEIDVLRSRVRERGTSYAAVLTRALADPIEAGDAHQTSKLASGVFDDPDVVFIRATDTTGKVIFEAVAPDDASAFAADHEGKPFQSFYAHQLDRDARGIVDDPGGLGARMEGSRHKDFAQSWNDFIGSIGRRLGAGEKRAPSSGAVVLFQDRLYVENTRRDLDGSVTYAIGRVDDPRDGHPAGAIIVAFDMRATNASIRGKYLKGGALVAFFVFLIVVQNIVGRREKLRLLDLETRQKGAREAILRALPADVANGPTSVAGALSQTERGIDGVVWDHAVTTDGVDVVVIDPQGDGIDAAAVSLHVLAMLRQHREDGAHATVGETLVAAGKAALQVPLTRAIGLLVLRCANGRVEAVASAVGGVRRVRGNDVARFDESSVDDVPSGVVAPLRRISGAVKPGDRIVIAADGLAGAGRLDIDAVAAFVQRGVGAERATSAASAVAFARSGARSLAASDIVVVTITA